MGEAEYLVFTQKTGLKIVCRTQREGKEEKVQEQARERTGQGARLFSDPINIIFLAATVEKRRRKKQMWCAAHSEKARKIKCRSEREREKDKG